MGTGGVEVQASETETAISSSGFRSSRKSTSSVRWSRHGVSRRAVDANTASRVSIASECVHSIHNLLGTASAGTPGLPISYRRGEVIQQAVAAVLGHGAMG